MIPVNRVIGSSLVEDDGPTGGEPVTFGEVADWNIERVQPFLEFHPIGRA